MRRSKSDPAKYARNYRKISQRHMTGYGDANTTDKGGKFDESKEQKRLEAILKQSEETWKRGLAESGHGGVDVGSKKKKKGGNSDEIDAAANNAEGKDGDGGPGAGDGSHRAGADQAARERHHEGAHPEDPGRRGERSCVISEGAP